MQFKRSIQEIENQVLSPNLTEINKHLKKTKDQLDLRQDDTKYYATMGMNQSPKRLRLGGMSTERLHDTFDASNLMTYGSDRYMSNMPQTTRN